MASLAEMERELIVERTRAGLEVAKQLGRKGGRKPKMTDSKIESAKKLLASGVPPKDVARTLACRFRRSTTGCQPPRTLSVLYFPFSETTPICIRMHMHEYGRPPSSHNEQAMQDHWATFASEAETTIPEY